MTKTGISLRTLFLLSGLSVVQLFFSCTTQKGAQKQPSHQHVELDSSLSSAHVGISVYDITDKKFLYNYQEANFFLPASNTKLFSLYEGLKWLGDSLPTAHYLQTDTAFYLLPTGDPTLLHPDFEWQPLISLLQKIKKNIYILDANWDDQPWGSGWSWDDYNDDYMPERNALPVYGNFIRWVQEMQHTGEPGARASASIYSVPEVNWKVRFSPDTSSRRFHVQRKINENVFEVTEGVEEQRVQDVPFITHGLESAVELLKDTVSENIYQLDKYRSAQLLASFKKRGLSLAFLHSQPVDSLFRPMMYRSDNFFAEQTLLMVSNQKLGIMNDQMIIDTLLKTDLKNLPQKPNWADGSGLSRYNLFTPLDFVWLLDTMQFEFGLDRMKRLLPTGGTGTLRNYYKQDSGYIFAKTGSLSDVLALSGYIISKKNHLLVFSVLVNNHLGPSYLVRRAVESFLHGIRSQY